MLHTTLFKATIVGRLAAVASPAAVLTSLVNTPYEDICLRADPNVRSGALRAVRQLDRRTARLTSHFHAITGAVRDATVRHLHVAPSRITVVPRGRDPVRLGRRTDARRAEVRATLGIDDDAPVVLTVGRQEHQKGQRTLVEAVPALLAAVPGLVVLLAGRDGNASEDLRATIAERGVGDVVRLLGHRDDVPDLMAAADLFVFPSLWEGLGGSLIEAMALELPIVASDVPAIRETVVDGENAVLFPPGSAGGLAAPAIALLSDRDRSQRFGRHGRARFEAAYTLDRSIERMAALYQAVGGGA